MTLWCSTSKRSENQISQEGSNSGAKTKNPSLEEEHSRLCTVEFFSGEGNQKLKWHSKSTAIL